jgi:hypothetical protein
LRSILHFTPIELCLGHKPSVSHFRPFGCKCFVLKRGNLDKFESRSFDAILFGYTPHDRSYRVYNVETNTVVESCDVTFDETAPTMIMVNYADLWLIHLHVATLLDGARLELRELKAHSTLLGAWTSCPVLRSELEAAVVEIKDLKHKLDHSSRDTVLSPPCETCVSLKGKLLRATKEKTELQQEVAYLTAHLDKTALSAKIIEEDLSRVEESATKSTYRLGVGFERCEKKGEKSAPKFIPSSSYHKEEKALKPTKAHYPSNPKPSFNPKREARKETPEPREEAFVCMFCVCAGHLDEFCFQ